MYDILRYLGDLLRFVTFLVFVWLGLRIAWTKVPEVRRFRINVFLAYTFAIHLAVGVFQRDDWPFSPYPLMRGRWDAKWQYMKVVVVGVDANGREWDVDPMAWSPVFPLVLQEWFYTQFPQLPANEKRRDAEFLFAKAENARQQTLAGRRFGNERLLGVAAAPDWWLYKRVRHTSATPFTGLRIYRELWYPERRAADPKDFKRVLIYEHAPRT